MSILIIAEHDNKKLKKTISHVLGAAQKIGGEIDVLVAGSGLDGLVNAAKALPSVRKVLIADNPVYEHMLAENFAELVSKVASQGYAYVLQAASSEGKDVLPRAAALLDVEPISDIIDVVDGQTFKRPIYAGNAIATVKSVAPIQVLTVRPTAFEPVEITGGSAETETIADVIPATKTAFVDEQLVVSDRPDLGNARIVVSGGRGVGSDENFKIIFDLADKLHAAVGASRAAVDAGYVSNEMQVGQTGRVVAPELYIAIGISGAIQHLAGMKDSKVIAAINKDPEAPIFQVADFGLVADLNEAVPELTAKL